MGLLLPSPVTGGPLGSFGTIRAPQTLTGTPPTLLCLGKKSYELIFADLFSVGVFHWLLRLSDLSATTGQHKHRKTVWENPFHLLYRTAAVDTEHLQTTR